MAELKVRTRDKTDPKGKPRVYFTCHFDDFSRFFDKICEDIFATVDCAVYYTEDMTEPLGEANFELDLGMMNLMVVPVTLRLLTEPCRAMAADLAFAKEHNIPILPFMMEAGLDSLYSLPEKFGQRQYLDPLSRDESAVEYKDKLRLHLDATLINAELARRVRAAFDAYVFLSYRKKDRLLANRLMRIIHNIPDCRDIAVWYDEFLTPGESFVENIERAMEQSRLFTLLVTPNLLEEGNFVMREEYPAARRTGMDILPAEMERTDLSLLRESYEGIPDPLSSDSEEFRVRLVSAVKKIALSENDGDPEHNFLIGLAYLDGIDVEVNAERAISLIGSAADDGLPEAMERLFYMYYEGKRVGQDYGRAAYFAELLVNYYTEAEGEDSENTVAWLHLLALTQSALHNYERALAIQEKVYNVWRRTLGERHPSSLTALCNLAMTKSGLGRYSEAAEDMKSVYTASCEVLGKSHPETLRTLTRIGYIYINWNYSQVADRAYDFAEAAYEQSRDLLGEEHPDTLSALNNLAMAYNRFGNSAKAIELQSEVCDIAERVLGSASHETLLYKSNLAIAYQKRKKYKRSAEILEGVLAAWEGAGMEKHPNALLAAYNLTNAYYAVFRFKRAKEVAERLYARQIEVFGADHPDTATYHRILRILCISCFDFKRWLEVSGISLEV